jgi:hypothetical protein
LLAVAVHVVLLIPHLVVAVQVALEHQQGHQEAGHQPKQN